MAARKSTQRQKKNHTEVTTHEDHKILNICFIGDWLVKFLRFSY